MIHKNLSNIKNNSFGFLLDVIPFETYAVDIKTHNIVYINKALAKRVCSTSEEFCWEKIYGQNKRCKWCTLTKLTTKKKIVSTVFDESSNHWLQAYDELVTWPDGRVVKCTILVDITEIKEMQASWIQTYMKIIREENKLKQINKKYELLTKIDYLTGINNRKNFFHLGNILYKNNLDFKEDISIVIFDIDNFKQLNEFYGYQVGDKVLIKFCREIEKNIDNTIDIFGRIGDDEFVLILRSSSGNDVLSKIESIRKSIEYIYLYEKTKKITFSASIGFIKRDSNESLDNTLKKANRLLINAKNKFSLKFKEY
jgi:diguanylate cyclase (GGDEF)-like protein